MSRLNNPSVDFSVLEPSVIGPASAIFSSASAISCVHKPCLSDKCGEFAETRHAVGETFAMVNNGDTAPSFTLPSNGGGNITIPSGQPLVLFFYPKDNTPGCTTEAKEFSALRPQFDQLGVQLVGLSPDSVKKHDNFIAKHGLTVDLASDPEHLALQSYGVWVEKSMYGRKYMGVERSTFLIGADGTILESWRKVKVKGHVEAVLTAAQKHFGA